MAGAAPIDATASDVVGSQPLRQVMGRPSLTACLAQSRQRRHSAIAMPLQERRARHITSVPGNRIASCPSARSCATTRRRA